MEDPLPQLAPFKALYEKTKLAQNFKMLLYKKH